MMQQQGPAKRIILNCYFVKIESVESKIESFLFGQMLFFNYFFLLVTPVLCNSAFLLLSSSLYYKYESWQTHLCCVFNPHEGEKHVNLSLHPGYMMLACVGSLWVCFLFQCLPADTLAIYSFSEESRLDGRGFQALCPTMLQQLDAGSCRAHKGEEQSSDTSPRPSDAEGEHQLNANI